MHHLSLALGLLLTSSAHADVPAEGDTSAPPVVTITSPADGATVEPSFDVTLDITGENLTLVVVSLDGTGLGALPAPTPGFSLQDVPSGEHFLEVLVSDTQERVAADTLTFVVVDTRPSEPPAPPPPSDRESENEHSGNCSTGNPTGLALAALMLGLVARRRRPTGRASARWSWRRDGR